MGKPNQPELVWFSDEHPSALPPLDDSRQRDFAVVNIYVVCNGVGSWVWWPLVASSATPHGGCTSCHLWVTLSGSCHRISRWHSRRHFRPGAGRFNTARAPQPNTNPEPNQPFIHLDPFIMINYLTNRTSIQTAVSSTRFPKWCIRLTVSICPFSAQSDPRETEDVPGKVSLPPLTLTKVRIHHLCRSSGWISQGDHRLVHQKLPRARLYMGQLSGCLQSLVWTWNWRQNKRTFSSAHLGIYYTIFGASMLWSANGLYKLIRVSQNSPRSLIREISVLLCSLIGIISWLGFPFWFNPRPCWILKSIHSSTIPTHPIATCCTYWILFCE
jgi:hypothetical protein